MFIGTCPGKGYTVDHIDRNRTNNHYTNLRWETTDIQATNRTKPFATKGRPVNQYSMDEILIKRWDSAKHAGKELKIVSSTISAVCGGNRISAGGFKWRYCDEVEVIEGEIWRQIPHLEYGNILASNMGRIKYPRGYISVGSLYDGYRIAYLKNIQTGGSKHYLMHRLIMATFVGVSDLFVNHKDGNKANNKLENLEYVTASENTFHAHETGLINQYCKPVIRINVTTGEEVKYSSVKIAASQNILSESSIHRHCKGMIIKNDKNGFRWRYEKEELNSNSLEINKIITLNISASLTNQIKQESIDTPKPSHQGKFLLLSIIK
jgi:hypothetical protein